MAIDNIHFEKVRDNIVGKDRERIGIGTLSEKTLHIILKNYYQPDEDKQEIPLEGYVADIFTGSEVIEIQTGQFNRMREKLKAFLPLYPVTIVYPISNERWLRWVDVETGEISKGRKSPKKENPYLIFPELYKIKAFLKNPNLRLRIAVLDMEEYKLLNGWGEQKKNNASKFDRIPLRLVKEYEVERVEDYLQFLPLELPEQFTVKELAKLVKCSEAQASVTMNILNDVEVVKRVGKRGNAYLYESNLE